MTRRTIALLAVCAIWLGILAACQPTGHPRCEGPDIRPWAYITAAGYTLDCDPPFDGTNDGTRPPAIAVTEHDRRTVYVWPERVGSQKRLVKILFHEAGHTQGFYDEWHADLWAWCRMTPAQRDGVSFLDWYSYSQCHRVNV